MWSRPNGNRRTHSRAASRAPPFGWGCSQAFVALFIAVVATFGVAELLLALMARF